MKRTFRRHQLFGLTVGLIVVCIGLSGVQPISAGAATTKAKSRVTKKRSAVKPAPTTRKAAPKTVPATVAATIPATVPPTVVATVPPTVPATSSTLAPSTTKPVVGSVLPTNSGASTIPSGAVLPTVAAGTALVSFERALYSITMPVNTPATASIYINLAPTFTDTLILRTPAATPGLTLTLDRNPVRNFFVMTITGSTNALPFNQVIIEASASSDPNVVLARTTLAVYLTGTVPSTIAGASTIPGGDPNASPGVIYSLSPATINVKRGGDAATVRIDMVRQGNFGGAVTFEPVSIVPVGVGTSFQANSTTLSQNYFFVSAGSSTPPGTYVLTFYAVTSLQRVPLNVTIVVVA